MNALTAGLWISTLLLLHAPATAAAAPQSGAPNAGYKTSEIPFTSHDGHAMLGKLALPATGGPFPVVVFVQTAEAATTGGVASPAFAAVLEYVKRQVASK